MTRLNLWLLIFLLWPSALWADCPAVTSQLELPAKLKLKGKLRVAEWGQVGRVLSDLAAAAEGQECRITFEEVFQSKRDDFFFPLYNNVVRTVPEESLVGATVFSQDGEPLGSFHNRVVLNKRGEYSYDLYYFQFQDKQGKLQSSGSRSLIDLRGKPLFLLKWSELRGRILFQSE